MSEELGDTTATGGVMTADGMICDENTEDCYMPSAKQFAGAHFTLWFFCWINAATLIVYWFVWFKPEMDADAANTAVLARNWWWMDWAWPWIVYGHVGLYGFPTFFGIFTWFGVKFFDVIYEFWFKVFIMYFGTLLHFFGSLTLLAGCGFWI